jgi:phosphoribosyl 1,2-cyclic phosphate phosphodiesterase
MRITFLGTGTSQGVPVINCDCPVCTSSNSKNKRMRCSAMVEIGNTSILIDTSIDMYQQFIAYPFKRIDAILFTHAHADHIFGLDELRRFNYLQNEVIPIFGDNETMDRIRHVFDYASNNGQLVPGVPNITTNCIDKVFTIKKIRIIPVSLMHGKDKILGYRISNFAYCTDVSFIPKESYTLLQNLDVLVLGALRERKHPRHFNLEEAITEAQKIGAKNTYFTHISHMLDHDAHSRKLPESCSFAYDGLSIEI